MVELWKTKKLSLPKRPIQYEILKYALHVVQLIEKKQVVSIQSIIDNLLDIHKAIIS